MSTVYYSVNLINFHLLSLLLAPTQNQHGTILVELLMSRLEQKVKMMIVVQLLDKLPQLPMSQYDNRTFSIFHTI